MISNAKRILVNVVPRKAVIKNFNEEDPRLPAVQSTVMKKVEGEHKRLMGRKRKAAAGQQEKPIMMPTVLTKIIDKYIKVPSEEFVIKPPGGIRTQWVFLDEQEILEEEKLQASKIPSAKPP